MTYTTYNDWIGRDAYDSAGNKVGEITDIYYDNASGRPEWVAVKTGIFGGSRSFAPIGGSQTWMDPDDESKSGLRLMFTIDQIKDAPRIDNDNALTAEDERVLYQHYGYDWSKREGTYGYGMEYSNERADTNYTFSRYNESDEDWSEERKLDEHTETVPVSTTVEIPVETTVRLRRYQVEKTKQVPVTETEERVEVVDVDADTDKRLQ